MTAKIVFGIIMFIGMLFIFGVDVESQLGGAWDTNVDSECNFTPPLKVVYHTTKNGDTLNYVAMAVAGDCKQFLGIFHIEDVRTNNIAAQNQLIRNSLEDWADKKGQIRIQKPKVRQTGRVVSFNK